MEININCPKCNVIVRKERPEYLNQSFDTDEEEWQFKCPECDNLFSS